MPARLPTHLPARRSARRPGRLQKTPNDGPAGLCLLSDADTFIKHALELGCDSAARFSRADTGDAESYEDHLPDQQYTDESKVPICDDLTIPVESIKKGVRLTDANVFRVRTTKHSVNEKDWPKYWPYDFQTEGDIRPDRRPIGKGVVITVAGMGFYPIFRGYIALCGETAGRYMTQIAHKRNYRCCPYKGFRVGQLLAMPDDFQENDSIHTLDEIVGRENARSFSIDFTYSATDLVGMFGEGQLTLAPLPAFTGFCPYVDTERTLAWTNEADTGCCEKYWDILTRINKGAKARASSLRDHLKCFSAKSGLFKSFQPADDPSAINSAGDSIRCESPANHLSNDKVSDECSFVSTSTVSESRTAAEKHEGKKHATNADPEDGPAAKKVRDLISEHSDRMDKKQHENMQSILGLANLSDEIKAARDLISTEEAAQIISAFQCIPGLEAHYGRMKQRIRNVSRTESDQMAKSIYLEAYAYAQVSQDSLARRSMPLTRDGRGHDISTEENQPMSEVQPPQDS